MDEKTAYESIINPNMFSSYSTGISGGMNKELF
jgi:hypothetical protein